MNVSAHWRSPAMLVGLIALFFAFTGDPFAAGGSAKKPMTGFDIQTKDTKIIEMIPDYEYHATLNCPKGFAAISGGWVVLKGSNSIREIASVPRNSNTGWEIDFYDPPEILGGTGGEVQAGVECMEPLH